MVKVDVGIPIPETRGGKREDWPWLEMEVGDSFFAAGKTIGQMSGQAYDANLRLGRKYACRTVEGGVRVWRID